MSTIWRSHQRCARCGWTGTTLAHRWNVISALLYLLAALVLAMLEITGTLNIQQMITWPVVLVALFWFRGVPTLLWRTNACHGCGQRMKVELIEGKAPR